MTIRCGAGHACALARPCPPSDTPSESTRRPQARLHAPNTSVETLERKPASHDPKRLAAPGQRAGHGALGEQRPSFLNPNLVRRVRGPVRSTLYVRPSCHVQHKEQHVGNAMRNGSALDPMWHLLHLDGDALGGSHLQWPERSGESELVDLGHLCQTTWSFGSGPRSHTGKLGGQRRHVV